MEILLALALAAAGIYIFTRQPNQDGTQAQFQQAPAAPVSRGTITSGGQVWDEKMPSGGIDYGAAGFSLANQGLKTSAALSPAFAASAAVPIIGTAVAVGAAVFMGIREHHKQAVATEAKTLNAAYPVFRNLVIAVCDALMKRQITPAQASELLDNGRAGYFQQVAPIIKGRWEWKGPQDYDIKTKPDPCNGPCVVGHYWIDGDAGVVKMYAAAMYNGGHGEIKLGPVPPNAGFSGAPETIIRF